MFCRFGLLQAHATAGRADQAVAGVDASRGRVDVLEVARIRRRSRPASWTVFAPQHQVDGRMLTSDSCAASPPAAFGDGRCRDPCKGGLISCAANRHFDAGQDVASSASRAAREAFASSRSAVQASTSIGTPVASIQTTAGSAANSSAATLAEPVRFERVLQGIMQWQEDRGIPCRIGDLLVGERPCDQSEVCCDLSRTSPSQRWPPRRGRGSPPGWLSPRPVRRTDRRSSPRWDGRRHHGPARRASYRRGARRRGWGVPPHAGSRDRIPGCGRRSSTSRSSGAASGARDRRVVGSIR